MAEAIEVTGASIKAALADALQELHCTKDDIEYVVLQQPKAAFLGLFGGRPARLRVMRKEQLAESAGTAAAVEAEEKTEKVAAVPEAVTPGPGTEAKALQAGETAAAPAETAAVEAAAPKEEPTAEEQLARAEKFLHEVLAAMQVPVESTRSESEEGTVFSLKGRNMGILIGKHGQTLDALQYLANLAANRGVDGERQHILLDIENYRARRAETLRTLADHLAAKACRTHREVRLEPMNRHERKIIHTALQDSDRVTTRSEGEEPRRYVVIVPRCGRAMVK